MSFESFNLSNALNKAISEQGFTAPSDIQNDAIPVLLKNERDFVGQAQTGTGKTAAFLLPLLENLDKNSRNVEAMILTPTRELALQVHEELKKFSKHLAVRSTTVYGGVSYVDQKRALKDDRAQIVVGTPGRIIDLIDKRILKLDNCKQLIIDEADEMLNMGFLEDVNEILTKLPEEKRLWMFSATMPAPILTLMKNQFSNPEIIKVKNKTLSNEDVTQWFCTINRRHFGRGVRRVLESQAETFGIVFCDSREEVKRIAENLADSGIATLPLHGDLSQQQRTWTMQRFRDKKVKVLVCTDVAARGIDVSHVSHVFNFGIPRQKENYVHRIGRTGRAGNKGEAITFISSNREVSGLRYLEKLTGQKVKEYTLPETDTIKKNKIVNEVEKMESMKKALKTLGEEFVLDDTYKLFDTFLEDLSKEDVQKLMFSYIFNKELKAIDEGLQISKPSAGRDTTSRSNSRNGRRMRSDGDRGRSYDRNGGGDRGRRTRSAGGNRSDSGSRDESRSYGGRSDSRSSGGRRDSRNSEGRSESRSYGGRSESRSYGGRSESRSYGGRSESRPSNRRSESRSSRPAVNGNTK